GGALRLEWPRGRCSQGVGRSHARGCRIVRAVVGSSRARGHPCPGRAALARSRPSTTSSPGTEASSSEGAGGPTPRRRWPGTPWAQGPGHRVGVCALLGEAALAAPPAGAALGGAGGAVAPALQQRPEEAVAMTATIAAKSLAETTAGTMTASTAEKSLAEMVGAPPANTWNIVATRASAGQNMNHITRLQNGMDRDLGSLEIWMSPFVNPCNGGCGLAAWCGVLLLLRLLLLLLCRPSAAVAALPLEAPVWPGGFLLRAVLLAAGGGGLRAAVPALAVSPSSVFVLGQSAGEATN
ncbi:unnamed protein product, partial [Prorocentrum cordatum]